MKHLIYIAFFAIALTSCFKRDEAITLPQGVTEISTCYLGDYYEKQMYFDLGTNTFQEKQLVSWDLSFESTDKGIGIFSNTINIVIRKANRFNLDEPDANDTDYILKQPALWDGSDGKVSTSAIGDWQTYVAPGTGKAGIYFIECTYNNGEDRFRKLQILAVNDTAFAIKITRLHEFNAAISEIPKDKAQNFTFYSFKNFGGVISNAEPPKENWDIEFTKYRTFVPFSPAPLLYMVSGVFSNRNNVMVAIDSTSKFEDIAANNVSTYWFNDDRDAIGYEYKSFDYVNGANGKYTVNTKITYIIKDTDGYYYKLRFLDFYDKQGRRGNPKFEYIRIK